jgi:mannitol/fructose-specific phosphotransferase system IIA component (Ntr-type)
MAALNVRRLEMQLATNPIRTLADFTSANLILPKLYERTTTGVINELNQRLQMHEGLPEHLFATTAAINHELLASMKLDGGMVLAQVRSATLPHTRFALGRAAETLRWRGSRLPPISFVALIVKPSAKLGEYERVVEVLNALAQHAEALKLMREATSAEEMLAILGNVSFHCR